MAAKKKTAKKKTAKKKKAASKSQSLVQCYGLYWEADKVNWSQSTNAQLLGRRAKKNKGAPAINFHLQTGIYVLYAGYDVVYVGQAGYGEAKLFNRLKAHQTDNLAERWDRFSWFGLLWVKTDGNLSVATGAKHPSISVILNQMEAILITSTEPALNRQGGRWGRAVHYLQVKDEKHVTDRDRTREIWNWVQAQKDAANKAKTKRVTAKK